MTLSVFLELVEIKTKLASLFPFVLGTLFAVYYFHSFNFINTLLFLTAMLLFDMATTVINNTMDYVKAKNPLYQKEENILGKAGLPVSKAARLIVTMVAGSALIGLLLVYRTDLLLLLIGVLCFLIGIFYTFGPFPISRMPLGEVLSGLTMGFGIFFIAVFINAPAKSLASFQLQWPHFTFQGNLLFLLAVFVQSLPLIFTIANIMLANNICDLETDVTNHRYTLVYYIGKAAAVRLYALLYYGVFAAGTLAVIFQFSPSWMLGIWLVFPVIQKNIRSFAKHQEKATTFNLAIKNLLLIHSLQIVLLVLGIIF